MRFLVFDTETTGLPKTKYISPDTLNQWPYIVQFSYIIYDTTLNDIIAIDNGYKFVGQVAELRLYNKSLTQGEIEQLYFSSNRAADDRSLSWNMSVGERNYIEQIKHLNE